MTKAYTVTVQVEVYGDSLENAKENAIQYFNQVANITDDEVKEVK